MIKKLLTLTLTLTLFACATYRTPDRSTWDTILRGASFGAMTHTAQQAKTPIFMGTGGRTLRPDEVFVYMDTLEQQLSEALRKPGIQISRAGNDIVIVMVRDAFMELHSAEFSSEGVDTLRTVSRILSRHNRTFIEISGYSDAMRDQNMAIAFTFDMAERVAVFMAQHRVQPVRMFVIGRGSARPIAGQDDIGRLMNRRIELRIAPVVR